ncbi:MAG TPA: peptidylprolyl isomerase [bacterium]|nr:peptidylprolyl isomerase [bacterium]
MIDLLKKRWFQLMAALVFLTAFFVIYWMTSRVPVERTPNVVADIAGEKISDLQFQTAINRRLVRQLSTSGKLSAADKQDIMLSVFLSMVKDTMLKKFAEEEGVKVGPADIKAKKEQIYRMLGQPAGEEVKDYEPGSGDGKRELAPEDKYTHLWSVMGFRSEEEFLKEIEVEILEDKLSRKLYPEDSYTVSDEEIEKYMPRMEVRQILLTYDTASDTEINFAKRKTLDRAQDIYRQLKAGTSFEALAKQYSHDFSNSPGGGYIGYINERSVVPRYWDVVSRMKEGEISEPFETEFGLHIVQVLDIRPEGDPLFDQMRAITKVMVLTQKRKTDFVAWFNRKFREYEEKDMITVYHPVILANRLRVMGKTDESIEQYRKAIETDKEGAPYYHIDIGRMYAQQKKYTEALRELRIATESAPTDPQLFFQMGLAYMEAGEHEKALSEFQKASSLSSLDYLLHAKLQRIYAALGMLELADREQDLYMKAIELIGASRGAPSPGAVMMTPEYKWPGGASGGASVREDSPMRDIERMNRETSPSAVQGNGVR